MTDTIAAIATAVGAGGVGIVRLSGPMAIAIAEAVIDRRLSEDRRVVVATARGDGGAGTIDASVIAFAMRGPRSFTGEDVVEIHGHGGAVNLAMLLGVVVARGARVAEPGEFTRRAVENGKLDLVRAEALLAVIHAGSERAWRVAQANLAGRLGEVVMALEARALRVLAEVEGRIDFPEDDIPEGDALVIGAEIAAIAAGCDALARSFRAGRAVEHGIVVGIVGEVNAGKSSLLNALIGSERALVDAAPGTTRDYVEARTEWNGVAVTLIDTAGLRTGGDVAAGPVEARGIALGEARVADADVILVLSDLDPATLARFGHRAIRVHAKCDLTPGPSVSASTSRGADEASVAGSALAAVATSVAGGWPPAAAVASSVAGGGPAAGGEPAVGGAVALSVGGGGPAGGGPAVGGAVALSVGGGGPTVVVAVATSAVTGAGLEELRGRVFEVAGVAEREGAEQAFLTTARQHAVMVAAATAFGAATTAWASAAAEVIALELREGTKALAQLRGVEVGERVLDEVFARFCIGK